MSSDPFSIYGSGTKHKVQRSQYSDEISHLPPEYEVETTEKVVRPSFDFSPRIVLAFAYCLIAIIIIRVFYLQVVQGQSFTDQAEGNRIYTQVEKAARGVLYDANGELLAKNIPNFTLIVHVREIDAEDKEDYLKQRDEIQVISGLEDEEFEELFTKSANSGLPVVLKEHIPREEAMKLMITTQDIPALNIDARYGREYTHSEAFGHILGYTGNITAEEYAQYKDQDYLFTDYLGKSGVEKTYEQYLRGTDGEKNTEVNFRGEEQGLVSEQDPIPGGNVTLNIDARMQNWLYNRLKQFSQENNVPGGSIVAMDPQTGYVKALVSYPSFDANMFVGGVDQETYDAIIADERRPLFHRAVTGEYPSGSTFKPIVAAAALEEGIIDASTTVNSTGGITIGVDNFPDWKAGGHGITNVTKALADSVNTFFYIVGGGNNVDSTGLGVEKIVDYARLFGLGEQSGIDLPGENDGFLPSKLWKEEYKDQPWYLGDTYHLAIGQGDILVTPLQVASFTATIANGGTYYTPQVVKSISQQDGTIEKVFEPVVHRKVPLSQESINVVRKGMKEAVEYGSARTLQVLPVESAGKTGTAQFGDPDKTHSWFTAFAPYTNPEIVVTTLVEEGGGGNDAALPITREFLQWYYDGMPEQVEENQE